MCGEVRVKSAAKVTTKVDHRRALQRARSQGRPPAARVSCPADHVAQSTVDLLVQSFPARETEGQRLRSPGCRLRTMLISAVRNSVADDRLGRRSGRCVHPGCLPADCAWCRLSDGDHIWVRSVGVRKVTDKVTTPLFGT